MSLKVKLISCISLFMLMIGVLIIGVYAATQQTINLKGNVNFDVADNTLYVNDIRVQTEITGESETIKNFIPGYINQEFNINMNTISSSSGSVNIYFDIVNTTTTTYTATATGTNSERIVSASGTINGDGISASKVSTYEGKSGTITLTIQKADGQSGNIDLSGITITISEVPKVELTVLSSNETIGQAECSGVVYEGEEVTLTANFTGSQDADFLGWRANTVDGELVSTLPEYTFTYQEDSPTTYYAIFETSNSAFSFTLDSQERGVATLVAATGTDIIVPSIIYRSNIKYTVTNVGRSISTYAPGGDMSVFATNVERVVLPGTIVNLGGLTFCFCSDLVEVDLSDCVNLVSIGSQAFQDCYSLKDINLSNCVSLTNIDNQAFLDCSALTNITIPKNVTSIGPTAFAGCSSLKSLIINATNPPTLGGLAFFNCSSLTNIYVPSASVSAYQSASGWSEYADKISAIV